MGRGRGIKTPMGTHLAFRQAISRPSLACGATLWSRELCNCQRSEVTGSPSVCQWRNPTPLLQPHRRPPACLLFWNEFFSPLSASSSCIGPWSVDETRSEPRGLRRQESHYRLFDCSGSFDTLGKKALKTHSSRPLLLNSPLTRFKWISPGNRQGWIILTAKWCPQSFRWIGSWLSTGSQNSIFVINNPPALTVKVQRRPAAG